MDEKEFEILWEEIRKIDRNMADLFDERVELTRRTALSKIEANIPVYDAKGEEKMWKSCRPCFRKCQTDSVSLDGIIY